LFEHNEETTNLLTAHVVEGLLYERFSLAINNTTELRHKEGITVYLLRKIELVLGNS